MSDTQETPAIDRDQLLQALGVVEEFRALLTRCAEALERQAEAAEIGTLYSVGSTPPGVIDDYCDRVAAELAEAFAEEPGR